MDIERNWSGFTRIAREALCRNWQNNRLWWNDPDCLVQTGNLPAEAFDFHKTVIYASGGMLLSGDDVTRLDAGQRDVLRRAATNPGIAAVFETARLETGRIREPDRELAVLLNWSDVPQRRELALSGPTRVIDFWTDEELGRHAERFVLEALPPRSGRLLLLRAE